LAIDTLCKKCTCKIEDEMRPWKKPSYFLLRGSELGYEIVQVYEDSFQAFQAGTALAARGESAELFKLEAIFCGGT